MRVGTGTPLPDEVLRKDNLCRSTCKYPGKLAELFILFINNPFKKLVVIQRMQVA